MKHSFFVGAVAGLMLGTSAFAQSPGDTQRTNSPAEAQSQAPKAAQSPAPPSAQNTQSRKQNTQSGNSAEQSPTNATVDSSRSQAQPNQAAAPSQARSDGNPANPSSQPSQVQSTPQPGSSSQPAQAQTNTPAATNQSTGSQQSTGTANTNNNATNSGAASTNTAAQPSNNQTNTTQSRANVNVSANLTESQRTRVSRSISRLNAKPVTNVRFSLSVGTVVPRDARFQPLPAAVVEVMPQYRGYNFVVVREDIVIVDPATYKIVDVLPRGGRSTAAAPAPRKATFSDSDREVVRKHSRSSRTEQRVRTEPRTTGSVTSTRVRVGDRLPDSVEIRTFFPDEVYPESPRLREYRYIERDEPTYIIEPGERRIIEEID